MFLSNEDIKAALRDGILGIQPLKPDQIGPVSVDLTLSDTWYFFKKKYIGKKIDLSKTDWKEVTKQIKSKSVVLNTGEVCLGKTVERIKLSEHMVGLLEGRSRYARMGLAVHITSSIVQPGSNNHQILEIVNSAPFAVMLYAGMRISQIMFSWLKTPTSLPYSKFGKLARRQ